jgi:hypothetical protein
MGSHAVNHVPHSLLSQATTLLDNINQWRHRYISSDRVPAVRVLVNPPPVLDDYPFHSVYTYRDVASATIITASYAYAIALSKGCVDVIQPDSHRTEANIEMARKVCMSVDYCFRSGYCGSVTMKFALPIAQSVLPPKYHAWIEAWLTRFSSALETTMAT